MRISKAYRNDIKAYCIANGLSWDKASSSMASETKDWLFLQHYDPNSERAKLGLLDNEPAPITLKIFLENGKLRFEQTDITHKYLGVEREVAPAPKTIAPFVRPSIPARQKLAYA